MSKLRELLKVAYDSAYEMPQKKLYSEPKIFDHGGDPAKRWYVYFSFRNPDSGKMERQPTVDTGINQYKTLTEKRAAAEVCRRSLSGILKQGLYNPFTDEDAHVDEEKKLTVKDAVAFVLKIKQNEYKGGFSDFKSRLTKFQDWLLNNGFQNRYINAVNKTTALNYLNYVLEKNSAANRNNTRSALSNFFATLEANGIVPINPVAKIAILKNKPQRNKSYTSTEENDIFEYLAEKDKLLALYIKFVSYNFLRPIEVSRLLIRNIDLVDKKLYVETKDGKFKIKIIPDILIQELPDLSTYNKNFPLFGLDGFGENWQTEPEHRRGLYGKRFKRVVKTKFGFGADYGMYSFRHTFIAKLFTAFLKEYSVDEAEGRTMHITGHATRQALRKYLRDIDAHLPADYSQYLKKVH